MNLPPNPRLCPQWIVAFIFFVFLPLRVQAGDDFGQEFSFDAISDLAPLIALFGEQVTKQFMSQSLNWYDHIIFAMAPLGIITAIVGAIRVGGPTWLKAVIGRARESRGMAEVELMSSVSPDVCELWNGGQIVRVMGQAPVVQILYFPHLADDVNCDEKGKGGTCGLHTLETAKEAGLLIPKNERSFIEILRAFGDCIPIFRRKSKLETEETGTVRQEDSRKGTRRTQNTKQVKPCAPNITLNFDYRIRPAYLQISAAIGLILQLGVIASQAVLAKHPKYQQKNQKVDKAFAAAAFEIAVVGTLILIFSMITCSYIIEQGSREVTWVVKNDKHSFHIMWVQKARTVNDQNFDSYLLLAKGARNSLLTSHPTSLPSSVTTSSLVDGDNDTSMDEDNDDMRTSSSNSTELLVCVSAFFGIIGFVLQFVGLRGLHWSATVAQIGATFVMTALRAWVRRDLAGKPHAVILPHEFELDWLSTRLGIDAEGLPRHDVGPSGTHSDKFNFWAYAEAEREREDARKKGQRKIFSHDPIDKQQHTSINAEFWGRNCINLNFVLRQVKPHIQPQIHTLEETERPNRLARIRYRLVDLTSWDYEVTKTASALDKVIEATMESLIGSRQLDRPVEYGWPMEVFLNKRWSSVMLTVRYTDGQWRSDRAELEAVLSLWMYSLKMPSTKDVPLHDGKKGPGDPDVDNEGTEGMKVQFLGWKSKKVLRDFTWWVTGHSNPIVEVKVRRNVHLKNTNASPSNGNGQASTSPSPSTQPTTRLNLLPNFSASTLSSTSSSASSWPRSSSSSSSSSKSVSTNTHIDEAEGTWFGCGMWHPLIESQQTFALEFDTDVLELELQNKVGTTEGSVSKETALAMAKYASEPTMCAMHIFSIFLLNITRCKLSPQMENDTKVEDKSTKEFTGISIRNTALDRLAQAIHNIGFYTREEAHIMLVSAMAENGSLPGMNKVMSWAFNKAQHYESKGRYDLAGSVYMWLYQCFSVGGVEEQLVTTSLAMLWEFSRSLSKILPLLGKHEHSPSKHHDTDKKIKKLLLEKTFDNRPQNIQGVDERKLLRHLPIISSMGGRLENRGHYVHPSFREEIKQISKSNPLLIPQSLVKALKADYSILDKNLSAETDIFGRNQLHYIAVNKEAAFDSEGVDDISTSNIVDEDFPNFVSPGHEVQDHLLELWGKIEISSITAGTTSSLETRAHSNVLHGIEQEVVNSRDSLGLTPLHYAAWAGNLRALKHLLHAGADSGICGHDGKTALHCAAINGNADMVKLLAEAGSSIHAKDSHERTPLHYACEYGNGDAVDRMLKFGASISAFDSCRRTPFHMVGFIGSRFQQEARRQCTCDSIKYLLNILLENNVDPSIVLTEEHLGCTALHLATAVHNECAIRHLISFRQDSKNLDATDREGRTALHYASRNGNLNSVLQLVAGGAICDIKDNKGWTPLHDAADGGYEDIVTFLLSPQDDVSSRTYSRIHNRHSSTSSPAPHVTTCTDSNISNVLQRNGGHGVETDASIDVYLVNNSSGTPGKGKSGNGVVSEVSDIYNEKIKSISKNKAGKSAKSYHVIDVNSGSNFNMTALHLASMKGHVGVVSSLLANGADYTLVASSPKRTAMQFAAIEGKVGVLSIIAEHGRTKNKKMTMNECVSALLPVFVLDPDRGRSEAINHLFKCVADLAGAEKDSVMNTLIEFLSEVAFMRGRIQALTHNLFSSQLYEYIVGDAIYRKLITHAFEYRYHLLQAHLLRLRRNIALLACTGVRLFECHSNMILLSAIDHEDGNNGPSDIAKSVRHEVEAELSIEDQELLIFAAAWCGRFEVVARYLNIWPSAGYWRWSVDPTKVVTSSRNRYYGTPLQAAILQEDIAMVELLLPSIGVYSIDDHGWSAMQCASFCSTNEIPELLVYVLEKLQGSNLPMENQGNAATMKSPSMWSTIHMSTHIEVDKSGLEARCISSTSFRYEGKYRHPIVQADHSFAKDAPVYFEVEILALADSGSSIAIGITKGIHPLNQLIGFQLDTYTGIRSWGYHCNNCVAVYNANPELIYFDGRHDATISKGDILGCGVTKSKEFFVTRNGVKYVTNFGGIQGQLFPVANVLSGGHIRANFGPTFKYDIYSDPDICTGNESGSSNGGSAATSVRGSAT